jgi:hypothetical protein
MKAKRPTVVITLEIKLKIIAHFEAGKLAVSIGRELGTVPTTLRAIIADKQKYKDVAKEKIFLTFNYTCVSKIKHFLNTYFVYVCVRALVYVYACVCVCVCVCVLYVSEQ